MTGEVHPGDHGPILRGDPKDGLPLEPGPTRWGMPNHWMASKGLDPFDSPVLFMTIQQASSRTGGAAPGSRCLVPVTSITLRRGTEYIRLSDPDRPLLTLAGLYGGIDRNDEYEYGFCFLTETISGTSPAHNAPLVVEPARHDEWMCGWTHANRIRSLCDPLLVSRMA